MSSAARRGSASVAGPPGRGRANRIRKWARARVDDLRLAASAFRAQRLRSGLTLLGIVIGVFTVVASMSLLNGLRASIDKGMGGLGTNVFQIQRLPAFTFSELPPEIESRKKLALSHVLALREALPQAEQVGGEVWEGGKVIVAGEKIDEGVTVAGGTPEFFTNNTLPIGAGRAYTEAEAMGAARVVVLGASVVDVLFPQGEAIGQHMRLGRLDLEVIGTIERQGGSPLGGDPDNLISIPIALFLELYGTGRSLNITVMAKSHGEMARLQEMAVGAFRVIRGLDAKTENDFDMFSNESTRATFDELADTVTAAGFVICAFSLIVGGIGVTNIMLVAVTERTREIGLRKALGARRRRILMQFVIEAILLAFFGGAIGVLLASFATLIGHFLDFPAEIPIWAVALGLIASSGIGLVAGIYPAWRASRLDPAISLRLE
jgi:putative ABC transport system permease protein